MYNICDSAIRWPASTSIKVVLEHFLLALIVFQILYIYIFLEFLTLKMKVKAKE